MIIFGMIDHVVTYCKFDIGKYFYTPFWEAKWLEETILREEFSDLYFLSCFKKVSVDGMRGWSNGLWCQEDFSIKDILLTTDIRTSISSLRLKLVNVVFGLADYDKVSWRVESGGDISVASCYLFYASFRIPFDPRNRNDAVLGKIWKMDVPYKFKAFGCRLFVNRLLTKDLLKIIDITFPINSLKCAFCDIDFESRNNFFYNCNVVKIIWNNFALRIGKSVGFEEDCLANFLDWYLFCKGNKVREGKLRVVWLTTLWFIWLLRNSIYFRNDG